ncbi:hypothetical protein TRVA0_063S00144 [Trichomonascus vanleenenianus]|uniref:uncharacterized protein n=1 Tax=Trichomonascus vanleenenianus TaxID=2268995 RepID=UPI003ECAF918
MIRSHLIDSAIKHQEQSSKVSSLNPSSSSSSTEPVAMISPPQSPAVTNAAPSTTHTTTTTGAPQPMSQADSVPRTLSKNPHTPSSPFQHPKPVVSSVTPRKRQPEPEEQQQQQPEPIAAEPVPNVDKSNYKLLKFSPGTPMVFNAWTFCASDPVAYYEREQSLLALYGGPRDPTKSNYVSLSALMSPDNNNPKLPPNRPLANGSTPILRSSSRAIKRRRYFVSDSDSTATNMTTRSQRSVLPPATPPPVSRAGRSRPSTPRPRRATGSPAVPSSKVHDTPYEELTDYSPPITSLPPGKSLKAEWKGAPMDLSSDPDAHKLHPAELHLASTLRLPVQLYLDSKKRLFAEKVHRLKNGLPFRRTDSQKACRIDVNKASRLFTAFEKVGWLDDEMFEKYL